MKLLPSEDPTSTSERCRLAPSTKGALSAQLSSQQLCGDTGTAPAKKQARSTAPADTMDVCCYCHPITKGREEARAAILALVMKAAALLRQENKKDGAVRGRIANKLHESRGQSGSQSSARLCCATQGEVRGAPALPAPAPTGSFPVLPPPRSPQTLCPLPGPAGDEESPRGSPDAPQQEHGEVASRGSLPAP